MISEQEAKSIIDYGRSQGFTQEQVFALLDKRKYELEKTKAQADWDKKHAEEKARIEAERKAAKEKEATDTALEKSFTFQIPGTEPKEEVEPVGILAPKVEKTAKEKNAEIVDQNAAENDKRQNTDFNTWYTDVFLKEQKKSNPVIGTGSEGYKDYQIWKGEFWNRAIKGIGTGLDYAGQLLNPLGHKIAGIPLSDEDVFGVADDLPEYNRYFWRTQGFENLEDEHKRWQGKTTMDSPDNIFENPSFEDYEAVQLPSAAGTTTTYRLKDDDILPERHSKRVISAKEYNRLKTEAEDQQIADDPSLGIYKKQQEAKENKDFKFYEAKYKEALDNNDSETAKHYFHKIKETGKESNVVPSDEKLTGEISEYFRLKDKRKNWGPSERDNIGRQLDEKIKNSSGFLGYYSEEEAQELLRKRIQEVENEPSEYMFSQGELDGAGINSEDFHNFVNNTANHGAQINANYNFDVDKSGNIVKTKGASLFGKDEEEFKANIINGYLNSKLQPIAKMKQQYDNLGVTNDIEHLNGLQLELKDGRTELDAKIQNAKDYAADIKSGKIKRTEENLDKLISMNAEVEVLTNEFDNSITDYNDYFKDERKSK